MHRAVRFSAVAGALVLGFAVPRMAHAQAADEKASGFTVDEALAKRGKSLFTARGCTGCHTIGKGRSAGPDLAHVTDRRTTAWLKSWLTNPPAMMDTDSTAKALLKEHNNLKMPNLNLKPDEIDALLNHIAKESEKVKK